MSDNEKIAEYIARHGVTRIAPGERTIDEKVFRRNRGDRLKVALDEQRAINERYVVIDHCGREHVRNGLGEWLS